MSRFNPIATNPVLTKDAATLAIFFLAWKAFGLSFQESAAIAGTFLGGTSPFVRALVRPTSREAIGRDDLAVMLHEIVEQTIASVQPKPTVVESDAIPANITSASGGTVIHRRPQPPKPERPDPNHST